MSQLDVISQFKFCSEQIIPICRPLNNLGIHTISVLINYDDGKQIYLSNNQDWIDDYYNLELYKSSIYESCPTKFRTGFNLWPVDLNLPVYSHGLQRYDCGKGITFCQRHSDHTAFYFFSGSKDNTLLNDIFLNNLSLFKNFSSYFYAEKKDLIASLRSFNFTRTGLETLSNEKKDSNLLLLADEKYLEYQITLKSLEMQFCVNLNQGDFLDLELTFRQKQILYLSLQGKSSKEIARMINISHRTVERHFELLRLKTGLRNKQALLLFLISKLTADHN
ncbi:LuxR family transcriptional regulator [Fluoribacter gormanii]|uniref:LuxR family transcriptional regulator n=1 Tax=Fluoribacter gormanii TaxID=464 RepID=UPI0010415CD4|nr:LuxR family transcriptional regulator [Fluoribacter gormanii]